jgi:hypothetical protein
MCVSAAMAQPPRQLYPSGMPPGVIGQRAGFQEPLRGYYQPVKLTLPEGCQVAFAESGVFVPSRETPVTAGLLVGSVYRFQITRIPFNPGEELYPSIELINRTYPPAGKELEFPIEAEITQEDLELALQGRFVIRVIYLENPLNALPTQGGEKARLMADAGAGQSPLEAAAGKGRPVAIVRIGNRVEGRSGNHPAFFFNSPPFVLLNP